VKHLGQKPKLPRVLIEEWLTPAALGDEWADRVAGPVIGCALLGVGPKDPALKPAYCSRQSRSTSSTVSTGARRLARPFGNYGL
jgi:hypothetical protein